MVGIDEFVKDPVSYMSKVSEEYQEKKYNEWRHEVRKVAREATVSMKDMAMYLYIDKYYGIQAKELSTTEKAKEFTRRFLNEQGVDV
jgi:hypothetical protein